MGLLQAPQGIAQAHGSKAAFVEADTAFLPGYGWSPPSLLPADLVTGQQWQ